MKPFQSRSLLGLILLFGASTTVFSQTSNSCFYVQGPRAGEVQFFPNFPPIPLGAPCNDGMASRGFAVPNGETRPRGRLNFVNGNLNCVDIVQMPVPYRPNEMIPKSGLATFDQQGRPVIFLRQSQLPSFSPPVRTFLAGHECGHHALGQVRAAALFNMFIGPPAELAADCFAMSELRRLNLVNGDAINNILQFLATVPGDPTTYPGPERVQRLRQCMAP